MKINLFRLIIVLLLINSSSIAQINLEWESPIKSDNIEMGWTTWILMKPPYPNQQRFYINDKDKAQYMIEGAYNLTVEYEYTFSQPEKDAGSSLGCIYHDLNNDGFPEFMVNKSYGTGYPKRSAFRFFDLKTNTTLIDFDDTNFSYRYSSISDIDKDGIYELIIRKEKYPDDGTYQLVVYNLNISVPTNIDEITPIDDFEIQQNYPNPFNPETKIRVYIPTQTMVKLFIYDIQGKEVKTLINDYLQSGNHEFLWDGRNEFGNSVASGIYFYSISYDNKIHSKKMLMLK